MPRLCPVTGRLLLGTDLVSSRVGLEGGGRLDGQGGPWRAPHGWGVATRGRGSNLSSQTGHNLGILYLSIHSI